MNTFKPNALYILKLNKEDCAFYQSKSFSIDSLDIEIKKGLALFIHRPSSFLVSSKLSSITYDIFEASADEWIDSFEAEGYCNTVHESICCFIHSYEQGGYNNEI